LMSNSDSARPIPLDPPVINAIGDDIVYILKKMIFSAMQIQ